MFTISRSSQWVIVMLLAAVFTGCGNSAANKDHEADTIESAALPCDYNKITTEFLQYMLGKSIDEAKVMLAGFEISDTTIYDNEDPEGTNGWKAIDVKCNGQTILLAEANWKNKSVVNRIQVFSPEISLVGWKVGRQWSRIRAESAGLQSEESPYAYTVAQHKKDPHLSAILPAACAKGGDTCRVEMLVYM